MNELHILVGIPGSGKTTRAQALLRLDIVDEIVCTDDIRAAMIVGRNNPNDDPHFVQEIEPAVWKQARVEMETALAAGQRPLLDAVNTRAVLRKSWVTLARKYSARPVAHVLHVPYDECVRRNAERDRFVPVDKIDLFREQFEADCGIETLQAEGWLVWSYALDRTGGIKLK